MFDKPYSSTGNISYTAKGNLVGFYILWYVDKIDCRFKLWTCELVVLYLPAYPHDDVNDIDELDW